MIAPIDAILWIPAIAVPLLAFISSYRLGAALNVLASGATFAVGVTLLFAERVRTDILIIDDFNIYLVTLTSFVGFTSQRALEKAIGEAEGG